MEADLAAETVIEHSNPVFGLEVRGFEHIPEGERTMRLAEIGPLWLGVNLNMFSISLGCVAIWGGLSLPLALLACVLGNLPYLALGVASTGAVRTGLPVTTLSRAVYGVRANALHAGLTWIASVCFEALNAAFGVFAWLSLMALFGVHGHDVAQKLMAMAVQLALAGGIAVLGHATMVYLQRLFAIVLGAVLLLVLAWTGAHADWHFLLRPRAGLSALALFAAVTAGSAVISSQPVSYLYNGPDWLRYLPGATPARAIFTRVFWWTFLPCVVLTGMGALWASLGDMRDPVAGLRPLTPTWMFVLFILAVIGGSVANNAPTFYSSGLSLQAVGLKVTRWGATLIDIAVSAALVAYILFVQDLSTVLGNFTSLLVAWSGPYGGVWVADGLLRRWRYDLHAIHPLAGAARIGAFRSWRAWTAFGLGALAAAATMHSPIFVGPVSGGLSGADLSWIAGPGVAATSYALLNLARRRARARPNPAGAR